MHDDIADFPTGIFQSDHQAVVRALSSGS